ncbi:MAG: Phosphoribosylformylglycinamidine synthase subunit PurS [candidate division WS2 bacterium]|nr:Phosphoribosylformylglycinamidine synthase subunit PurS [Candidatus Lithacetigena glycinireducens]
MLYKVKVIVMPRKGILDPQGQAVARALYTMDYKGINSIRIGKHLEMEIEGENQQVVEETVKEMCEKLLANTVIEDYRFCIKEA